MCAPNVSRALFASRPASGTLESTARAAQNSAAKAPDGTSAAATASGSPVFATCQTTPHPAGGVPCPCRHAGGERSLLLGLEPDENLRLGPVDDEPARDPPRHADLEGALLTGCELDRHGRTADRLAFAEEARARRADLHDDEARARRAWALGARRHGGRARVRHACRRRA